jgi:hypothetical protein
MLHKKTKPPFRFNERSPELGLGRHVGVRHQHFPQRGHGGSMLLQLRPRPHPVAAGHIQPSQRYQGSKKVKRHARGGFVIPTTEHANAVNVRPTSEV